MVQCNFKKLTNSALRRSLSSAIACLIKDGKLAARHLLTERTHLDDDIIS